MVFRAGEQLLQSTRIHSHTHTHTRRVVDWILEDRYRAYRMGDNEWARESRKSRGDVSCVFDAQHMCSVAQRTLRAFPDDAELVHVLIR